MATPSVKDIYVLPQTVKWYPSFPSGTDPNVVKAISRLYDLIYQQQDQISILTQGIKHLQS